ncbi:MAG: hypothetical protein HYY93_05470 [Planctomycetes bacterium]|nr:hypothetical protein [Planctomycetota bacterium]
MHRMILASMLLAVVAVGGCIDLEQEFTLNPDGSGKAQIKSVFAPTEFGMGKASDPQSLARKAAREEVEKAEGIDAWKDVSWKLQDDGRTLFQGTAYFRDVAKVKFHHQGVSAEFLRLRFSKADDGAITVECPTGSKGPKPAPRKLSEDELKAEMLAQRAKYQQMKPLVDSMMGSLKMRVKVNLPARVASSSNFKEEEGGDAVRLAVEGATFAKGLDQFMMDDAALRASLQEGFDLEKSEGGLDDALLEKLFGEKGPIRAVTAAGGKNRFDYEAEAAPARAGMAAIMESLGGASKTVGPAAKGEGFKSLRVVGLRVVYEADMESGVSPFNGSSPGVALALVGELAGRALGAKEGMLVKAVAGDGSDLLPESEFNRKIHWPKLTEDKTGILFEVEMGLPSGAVRSLKEVAGTIQYTVGGKTKEMDCGFGRIEAGASGQPFQAKIAELKASEFQPGHQQLQLELETSRDGIQAVLFYDEAGKAIEVESQGEMSMGESVTMNFSTRGTFPAGGKIVLRVYEDVKTFEIPFSVTNLDLPGRPAR